jgi:formylglycine-generating enzyme required for sulfatase activity
MFDTEDGGLETPPVEAVLQTPQPSHLAPLHIARKTLMTRISVAAFSLGLVCLLCTPAFADRITYQMVTVGDPGNAADANTGSVYGSVNYSYQIGKYDVTIGQYAAFLNAVAATDTYSLYNPDMGTNGNILGIQRGGSSGSYNYTVIGSANRPITYVSWFDAARFANWMTNGQGNGSTETGAYTLNGATSGSTVAANPGATFRLPTENEWYKAAYYSPNYVSPYDEPNLGGPGGPGVPGYYAFATQSDSPPGNNIGSVTNQANYAPGNVYSVTQSSYNSNQNYLTDVGAFTNSASFYGTFDQSGNVYQWNDQDGALANFDRSGAAVGIAMTRVYICRLLAPARISRRPRAAPSGFVSHPHPCPRSTRIALEAFWPSSSGRWGFLSVVG